MKEYIIKEVEKRIGQIKFKLESKPAMSEFCDLLSQEKELKSLLQFIQSLPSSVKNKDDHLYEDYIKSGKLKKQLEGK